MMKISAVILAGGYGKRFWPMSRESSPKQCLRITSRKTMVEETVDRLKPMVDNFFLSTNQEIADKIDTIKGINYVIEPSARNTAAAIGLSTIYVDDVAPDSIIFVETTDHYYEDVKAYLQHVQAAAKVASEADRIVLIGIKPTYPHPGLGYIKQGEKMGGDDIQYFRVAAFKEKPTLEVAKEYVEDGSYLWNSGMFVFKVSVMLDVMKEYMPALHEGLMKIKESGFDKSVIQRVFDGLDSISIDYGIMEKTDDLLVIRGDFPWDDVGDWQAMERIHDKDKDGNVIKAKHKGDPQGCIIFSDTDRLIETSGIKDLVIIDTADSLLVCSKERAQEVKKIVDRLESEESTAAYAHETVLDPHSALIAIDSSCTVDADCLVALIGVSGLTIKRTEDSLTVKS